MSEGPAQLNPVWHSSIVPVDPRTPHEFSYANHLRNTAYVAGARDHGGDVARAIGLEHHTPKLGEEARGTTWQPSGVSDVGAWDAEQWRADPSEAKRSNIERAFRVNESVDPGSRMSEPGTIPNQFKVAGARAALAQLGLLKIALKATTGLGGISKMTAGVPKPGAGKIVTSTPKLTPVNGQQGLTGISNQIDVGRSQGAVASKLQGTGT